MKAAAAFESLLNLDTVLSALVLVGWLVAGSGAGRIAGRPALRGLRAGARRGLAYLVVAFLLAIARLTVIGLTATRGWLFVADRVVIIAPALLFPAVAVAAVTVPRMMLLARLPVPDPTAATDRSVRAVAAAPALVVPVHLTALGAAYGLWFGFLHPVMPLTGGTVVAAVFSWLVLAFLLQVRQVHRQRRLAGLDAAALPRFGRRLVKGLAVVVVLALAGTGAVYLSARSSVLPDTIAMSGHTGAAPGGGHGAHAAAAPAAGPQVGVTDLVDRSTDAPTRRFTLTAEDTTIRLASGATVAGKAFNGQSPGPELRITQGELVEVTLVNHMAHDNVTLHWHGIDVPNAMDGVPGVTQDAVEPGGQFVYRFRAEEVGTHWYHTHQDAANAVAEGLFGPLIVEPREGQPAASTDRPLTRPVAAHEIDVMMHGWPVAGSRSKPAFGTVDQLDRRAIPPGTPVRLRVVDTDSLPRRFVLDGTPFKVTALDGNPVNGPTDISDRLLTLGSGGRADLEFVMPAHPVRLTSMFDTDGGLLLSPDGTGDLTPVLDRPDFDATSYGTPAPTPFGASSAFDREYTQVFDSVPGFYDGALTFLWTTDGQVFPDVDPLVVSEGELVKVQFVNRSRFDHPMHLHGHEVLVLSHNGKAVTGSPLWLDTVDVDVGETWEVAFRADNPGIWMDHCHDFLHAEVGMMLHLNYEGVQSPFSTGRATPNNPA